MRKVWLQYVILMALPMATPALGQPADREAIERVVREYLLANPEIIEEAFSTLQEKRAKEALLRRPRRSKRTEA